MNVQPVLVTGVGGGVGGVGRTVVDRLHAAGVPVRALVHHDDERAAPLHAMKGVDVVVGDLTRGPDVVKALEGCRRAYFGMSVSPAYLEATTTVAAAARRDGRLDLLVNMSQMTVSQMDLTSEEESRQQRMHWLAEQVLDWSGVPVVHVRPTVFMENPLFARIAVASILRDGTIRLPFGSARTSPVSARDVADVVACLLLDPVPRTGRVYELTGERSRDMTAVAAEFSAALGRPVTYVDVPYEEWLDRDLKGLDLPPHVFDHIATMARLHGRNRYDRVTDDIAGLLGRPPRGFGGFVEDTPALWAG
ncbi:NmrA family NAD(P)-binding protein [Streptomyces hesseae]|uniref:NAD(P)H-binding protein n=1 Tax=Streptomyces hesseae TaxID=3075519 RepID=A0ABU2SNX1_9ACTN|nr:NAD(P)H-binding protein [Streptomyces sp. DSM 40473]MDT0449609.1 NAD(P)H-binding protein [Streptomyces sp. DSM 40473]